MTFGNIITLAVERDNTVTAAFLAAQEAMRQAYPTDFGAPLNPKP